jgi:toxin-antitoxin system PIN domain toxin
MSGRRATVSLPDVNVLIALFDPGHIHHDAAHEWFASVGDGAWATCPLTENGFVRVLSNPAYPGRRTTVADAAARLGRLTRTEHHVFWQERISILDPARFSPSDLTGHREITDAYLLGLAVAYDGALVTFDRGVRLSAVVGAERGHLVVLPTKAAGR